MAEWKAAMGRVSLFQASPSFAQPPAFDLYQRVWKSTPDNFQKPPNPLMPAWAQGRRGTLAATCIVQQGRVDLNLTPPPPPQYVPAYPLIDDMKQLQAELAGIANAVGQDVLPSIVRVAVSAQFLNLQPSIAEANRELTTIIPGDYAVKVTNEEDFILQVNRPYNSREPGVRMNSLTKWSVDRLRIMRFVLPLHGGIPTAAIVNAPIVNAPTAKAESTEFIAASVVLDINNVPTEAPLSPAQQSSLLSEAVAAIGGMQQYLQVRVGALRS